MATAFQVAGFLHVVGTLWEIHDRLAYRFANRFYGLGLVPGGRLAQVRRPSSCTRLSAQIRERVAGWFPSGWATHIHLGG